MLIGYPGRIPRGQDHIATAHFKATFGWFLFVISFTYIFTHVFTFPPIFHSSVKVLHMKNTYCTFAPSRRKW